MRIPSGSLTEISPFSLISMYAFSIGAVSFLTVTLYSLSSPYPLTSVSSMFVGGTIAIPASFVRLVSVLSVLSLTVTDISFTGLSSLSVTVTEILFARSSTLLSGSTMLILPSTISRYALAIGAFSSAITTLYPDTTALPLASVISL